MAQRQGFKNIQIQSKQELYDLFEDTLAQSGANSKAEFLRTLIDSYLNPEESNSADLKKSEESLRKSEEDLRASEENLKIANEDKQKLLARLGLYETDELKAILKKHQGERLVLNNYQGKRVSIEINDLPDVFLAIFNSVKIK